MFGFELIHLYAGFLVFGVGYAIIVSLLGSIGGDAHGDAGDGGGGHFGDAHGDGGGHGGADHASDGGGGFPFNPLALATFATLFGGLGFVSLGLFQMIMIVPQNLANTISFLVSASLALILSSYFSFFLVKLFVKTETSSNISTTKLIGREAEVLLDLEPGKLGEIAYTHAGSRQTNMARLIDGVTTVKKGQPVEIVSVNENVLMVKPLPVHETGCT